MKKSERTKERLSELSRRLIEAQRKITILDAIKWKDEIRDDFFKHDCKKLPKVNKAYYESMPLPFDVHQKKEEFRKIICDTQNHFGSFSPISRLIIYRCQEYIRALEMLAVRGTPEFSKIAIELYGSPTDAFYPGGPKLVEMGATLFGLLTSLDVKLHAEADVKKFTAKEGQEILQAKLTDYFQGSKNPVKVLVSDGMVADASAGADSIRLKEGVLFSERDLRCLEVHEGWVHVGTTINGAAQPYCDFLSKGSPSCSVLQEGLAVLTEVITMSSYPSRMKKITNRVVAMDMVVKGANFIDVFEHFLVCGCAREEAYAHTVRVFRGSTPEGGPFTKDLSYAKGFLLAYNYILFAIAEHAVDIISLLFVGKISLEDLPMLVELRDLGLLENPPFLPPQIRDLSGLSSWMSIFLYLDKFDFKEIQKNFRFLLPK
jgi:uncharacterized protein (TIGR02421 family)